MPRSLAFSLQIWRPTVLQKLLHLGHHVLLLRILGEIFVFVGIGLIVVQFRSLLAFIPLGVTIAFVPDRAADHARTPFGGERRFVPGFVWILEQRHKTLPFTL